MLALMTGRFPRIRPLERHAVMLFEFAHKGLFGHLQVHRE